MLLGYEENVYKHRVFVDARASVSSRGAPVGVAKTAFPLHGFLAQKSLFPNLQQDAGAPLGPTELVCQLLSCSDSPLPGIRTRPTAEAEADLDPICRGKNPILRPGS